MSKLDVEALNVESFQPEPEPGDDLNNMPPGETDRSCTYLCSLYGLPCC